MFQSDNIFNYFQRREKMRKQNSPKLAFRKNIKKYFNPIETSVLSGVECQ
jgi:hypothetical protein